MRSILILVPLLGVTYMFFLFPPHPSVSRAWKYINAFLSSTQVSIISIRSFLAAITHEKGRKLLFAGYHDSFEAEETKSCHLSVAEGRNLWCCEEWRSRASSIKRVIECWVRVQVNPQTGEWVEEMKFLLHCITVKDECDILSFKCVVDFNYPWRLSQHQRTGRKCYIIKM